MFFLFRNIDHSRSFQYHASSIDMTLTFFQVKDSTKLWHKKRCDKRMNDDLDKLSRPHCTKKMIDGRLPIAT